MFVDVADAATAAKGDVGGAAGGDGAKAEATKPVTFDEMGGTGGTRMANDGCGQGVVVIRECSAEVRSEVKTWLPLKCQQSNF